MNREQNAPQLEPWTIDGDLAACRITVTAPCAAVLLRHGFATHATPYTMKLYRLAQSGIAPFAYDLRGHGRSPGRRAPVERFATLVDDSLAMRARVRAQVPGVPLALRIVPGGYHEPTRDPGGDALFGEIIARIAARAASAAPASVALERENAS